MAFEIDYLPVDGGEKSGDAIAIRFGDLNGLREKQKIIVIDGGFQETGELLVDHITKHYHNSNNYIDLVISTHSDGDHCSGLSVVLEKFSVGQLAMHRPWEHVEEIKNLFKNGHITASGLEDRLEKSLQHASDLEALANKKEIPIVEPFQGMTGFDEVLHILGPSKEYYKSLLPDFRSTPKPKGLTSQKILVEDSPYFDLLNDECDTTSSENNTSTIILFELEDHKLLFTGDAGKTALLEAIGYAENSNICLADLHFLDVPHHGSKRNINSKILKNIKTKIAYVSASKDSKKHPSKKVTNGLNKNGASVFVTRGSSLLFHSNGNNRGWGAATAEPFHSNFEE